MSKKITLLMITAIVVLSLLTISVGALAETTTTVDADVLEYSEIAEIVSNQNIQIESAQLLLDKLQDSVDEVEESLAGVEYTTGYDLNSIYSQLSTTKIQVQQTEDLLINTAQYYYVSYNQLRYNLPVAKNGIEILKTAVLIAEINYKYGLGDKADVDDAKAQLTEAETEYLTMQNQMSVLLSQLKILLDIDPEATLEIGDVPAADLTYMAAINCQEDMATALANSYTLKIKNVEATYSPSNRKSNILVLEQAERDAKAAYLQDYAGLGEQSAKTELAQQKLAQAELTLSISQQQYAAGLISKLALANAENQYATAQAGAKNEEATLFWDIESYKAMIAGLLSGTTTSATN